MIHDEYCSYWIFGWQSSNCFYESGNKENLHFGSALFKKNLLGWKLVSSSTGELSHGYKLDWGFSNLKFSFSDYTDLIGGKVLDPQIEEVNVKTNGEDLIGSTITGFSSNGKII